MTDSTNRSSSAVVGTSLLAIVVLYKTRLEDSIALRTLRASMSSLPSSDVAQASAPPLAVRIMVYDNTPELQTNGVPGDLLYVPSQQNRGLAAAYNEAVRRAKETGVDWLLTLDQDTSIPPDFLARLAPVLRRVTSDNRVAAVVPRLRQGKRTLSPHWYLWDCFRCLFPASFSGVPPKSVYAFNSGATCRVTALEQVGGYDKRFWLDYSDMVLFRQFHFHNLRVLVASDLVLGHELSLLDATAPMSEARFGNILEAGSAYFDAMRGPFSGMVFTLSLVKSYVANRIRRRPHGQRRLLVAMLKLRLLHRKAHRLRRFDSIEAARFQQS